MRIKIRWRDLWFIANRAMGIAMVWPAAKDSLKRLAEEDPAVAQVYALLDEIYQRIRRR